MRKQISALVPPEGEGRSVKWVLQRILEMSPREISQAKFRSFGICVNGQPRRVTEPVHGGDLVEACLEEEELGSHQLLAVPGELSILYEDSDVLAVHKPAGLVCHPVGGHYRDTLANIMQYYFREKGEQVVIRLIGRLDRETSGIVLAAKSQAAASRLNWQKETGLLKKEYMALVQGQPSPAAGWVEEPIGPAGGPEERGLRESSEKKPEEENTKQAGEPSREICMQVRPDGKPARTYYETLATREGASLVRLRLDTGRTHQIRVHMEWLGCPLLGDTLYHPLWNKEAAGDGENTEQATLWGRRLYGEGEPHAALHAGRLEFLQPFTKERICLTDPAAWGEAVEMFGI